ncbi:hypothetical protein B0H12DRAFT_1081222 [Mycena haematopus]|nr:hypothetical protein B0H12DRAFT_1081222 [Mycena haematopus]
MGPHTTILCYEETARSTKLSTNMVQDARFEYDVTGTVLFSDKYCHTKGEEVLFASGRTLRVAGNLRRGMGVRRDDSDKEEQDTVHRQSARTLTLPGAVACEPPVIIPGASWRSAGFQLNIPVNIPGSFQLDVHVTSILLCFLEVGLSVKLSDRFFVMILLRAKSKSAQE